jgi:hypothetical protein
MPCRKITAVASEMTLNIQHTQKYVMQNVELLDFNVRDTDSYHADLRGY